MSIIHFKAIAGRPSWLETALLGSDLRSLVGFGAGGWQFAFSDHGMLTTSSLWRVVSPKEIVVTSEDHGQMFGLPSPVSVFERVANALPASSRITGVTVSPATADLRIDFGPLAALEIISTSCGYEAWLLRVSLGSEMLELVGLGGGGLSAPVGQRD
ncbi:MAG: hypothetical protein JSR86_14450 [Proteobacteria bacterium]|nr:hypothetical protein [Pseudomonadota bacterium]